uniref:ATP-dependent Clp protease proteolytic subunit n=1 Tax=Corydalis shensiana TaxID=2291115 RepID=A0A7S8HQA4_9MAGN|nr:clp protease proteolytic subunit protein [Corydalis shensiana]QPC56998.1 clp protease proteolytic subunit protein [Corydalis shensiana]
MPVGIPKVPFLIPEDEEATWVDIYNRLHRERALFLCQKLDFEITNTLVGLVVFLSRDDKTRNQFLFIHCIGGWAICGMGLFDMMRYVPPHVYTLAIGSAYSIGSLVVSGGEVCERIAYPNARVMIHQPASSYIGPEVGVLYMEGDEFKSIYKNVLNIYKQTTGQSLHVLQLDMIRDFFMTPAEAQIHGIVDCVGVQTFEVDYFKDRRSRTDLDPNDVWELIP